jgi:hypothetical protein
MNLVSAPTAMMIVAASLSNNQTSESKIPQRVPEQVVAAPTALKCILASNVFVQRTTEPAAKAVAEKVLYFYLGRLPAQITPAELKLELKRTADSLNGVKGAPLMKACTLEMAARAQMLQSAAQLLRQGK